VDELLDGGFEFGMASDRSGNVFVAGDVDVALSATLTVVQGRISRTTDHGATWTRSVHSEVESYTGIGAAAVEIAPATESTPAVLQDQLVAAGITGKGQWVTRRSVDAGASWETVDILTHGGGVDGAAIDSAGNLYVIGHATKTTIVKNRATSSYYWVVRRIAQGATAGSDLGKTTFELYETANGGYSNPHGVTCVGTNVFVAGVSGDRWQVRKLGDGQASWILIDDYRYDANLPSGARGITADGAGNLYVVGYGNRAVSGRVTASHWIVRRGSGVGITSTFGGISFQTVDDQSSAANGVAANGVCVDPGGNVYVTGKGGGWITRRHSASSALTDWVTSDSGGGQIGWDVVSDPLGNIFSAGWTTDGIQWAVRRLLAP
jgi:hypothetical protein